MATNEVRELEIEMSEHSRARMQQRGITARMVRIALECGEQRWSHDALCHEVTERALCGTPFEPESDRLRGLCVVRSRDGIIITVKWGFQLRRPGPLRRANRENWHALRRVPERHHEGAQEVHLAEPLRLAA
jgi:hypothetical protein